MGAGFSNGMCVERGGSLKRVCRKRWVFGKLTSKICVQKIYICGGMEGRANGNKLDKNGIHVPASP